VLAFARPVSGPPLAELLVAEQQRFGRTDTVIIVTGSREDAWIHIMRSLVTRGVHCQTVFVDAGTFSRMPSGFDMLGALAAARVPTYLIRRGEPIQRALSSPAFGPRGAGV